MPFSLFVVTMLSTMQSMPKRANVIPVPGSAGNMEGTVDDAPSN